MWVFILFFNLFMVISSLTKIESEMSFFFWEGGVVVLYLKETRKLKKNPKNSMCNEKAKQLSCKQK